MLCYVDGSRRRVGGFCLFDLELQLGYFELMLPCSVVFFLLLSELHLMLSYPVFFFGVNRVTSLGDGGLSLGQLLLQTSYFVLGC